MVKLLKNLTLTINSEDQHILNINVNINAELEQGEGWSWEVACINSVELAICDKIGIDITSSVLADRYAAAMITAIAADQEVQIYEALAGKEVAA